MATLVGIAGGLSGKMGNVVFRQNAGRTIAAQYQPSVSNPNSEGQQATRAKFKLMSQLGAIMAPALGSFNSRATESQRNAFFRKNQELVEITTTSTAAGDEVVARIPMEQLQLTDSFRSIGDISLTSSRSNVTASVSGLSNGVSVVRFVCIGYGTLGVNERPARARIIAIADEVVSTAGGTGIIHEFEIPENAGSDITVLAYGFIPLNEDGVSAVSLDTIHTPSDENFVSQVTLAAAVRDGNLAETMTIGANTTLTQA